MSRLLTVPELLEYRVEPEPNSGCWIWIGSRNTIGYGHCWRGRGTAAKYAHRVFYEFFRGEISAGLELDHLCRTPSCVNPAHLEAVTHQENNRRGMSRSAAQARQTHCLRGHEFTDDNTYRRPDKHGGRNCRECRRIRDNVRAA